MAHPPTPLRRNLLRGALVALLSLSCVGNDHASAQAGELDQGKSWTEQTRNAFYTQDQGSRMIPLAWFAALKQPNGRPFAESSLERYGYLPNPNSVPAGLPVGFTVAQALGGESLGMTCAACHTREITVSGESYRIDGGPAISDFPRFLSDLNEAVLAVLGDAARFDAFATQILGPSPAPSEKDALREDVERWSRRFDTLVKRSLGDSPSDLGRLDAVQMIFNRLTGLDIGPPPDHLIPDNIKPATAPVRYPFIWNAAVQDKTQWPGFADNGNDILGLARNCGEVLGVFAEFHPKKKSWSLLGIDYLAHNSTNFGGLKNLEDLIWKIGPPEWPWEVDAAAAERGRAIFDRGADQGGCGPGCHEISTGEFRSLTHRTWATPLQDVGTDSREYDVLATSVETGLLSGARVPFSTQKLGLEETAFRVLRTVVVGSILQHYTSIGASPMEERSLASPETAHLEGAFREPEEGLRESPSPFKYESRVLEGIWATAPYLHNGSVPTLAELLKPASERVVTFAVGTEYDPEDIGLAKTQPHSDHSRTTTGCDDRNSGNSRCGHEFGTELSAQEKRDLLEYLKTL